MFLLKGCALLSVEICDASAFFTCLATEKPPLPTLFFAVAVLLGDGRSFVLWVFCCCPSTSWLGAVLCNKPNNWRLIEATSEVEHPPQEVEKGNEKKCNLIIMVIIMNLLRKIFLSALDGGNSKKK